MPDGHDHGPPGRPAAQTGTYRAPAMTHPGHPPSPATKFAEEPNNVKVYRIVCGEVAASGGRCRLVWLVSGRIGSFSWARRGGRINARINRNPAAGLRFVPICPARPGPPPRDGQPPEHRRMRNPPSRASSYTVPGRWHQGELFCAIRGDFCVVSAHNSVGGSGSRSRNSIEGSA